MKERDRMKREGDEEHVHFTRKMKWREEKGEDGRNPLFLNGAKALLRECCAMD